MQQELIVNESNPLNYLVVDEDDASIHIVNTDAKGSFLF
jgi:hypothetical protein